MNEIEEELIIIGNGSYARMMKRYLELSGSIVKAYAIERECILEEQIEQLPVIPLDDLGRLMPAKRTRLIMGIGYRQMGTIREKVFSRCKSMGYQFANYIHPTAVIEGNVILGEGNNILEGVILEESVVIGDGNLLFGGCMVAHESYLGNFNTLSVKSVVAGCTQIKNNCFIGAGAVLRDHIVVEDYGLVGAGAYAWKSLDKFQVFVPARSEILEDRKSTELI